MSVSHVGIDPKVILIGGRLLAELMIDYVLGTTKAAKYEVCRIDSDHFRRVRLLCGGLCSWLYFLKSML